LPATATVNVLAPPTIGMAFADSQVQMGMDTSLSFTITNPAGNPASLTGIGFTDNLPMELAVSVFSNVAGSCGGGTITAVPGSNSIGLFDATLAPGASCTFAVTITGVQIGYPTNTTSALTSSNGGAGQPATANLSVVQSFFFYGNNPQPGSAQPGNTPRRRR